MLRPVLVLLGLCLSTTSAWAQACLDVRSVDFRNAAIHTGQNDERDAQAVVNGAVPAPDSFQLQHGVALVHDDPAAPVSSPPDWRVELTADRKIHADASTWVRVIVLEEVHLTGTGTWEVILAFACDQGRLVRLLQYGADGVILKHLDAARLELYQALWKPSDAACCPSRHVELTYAWNEQDHRYRRARAAVGDGFDATPDEK